MIKVPNLSDADVVFPANISQHIPSYEDIPSEFKGYNNPYSKLFEDLFYHGLHSRELFPCEGVDEKVAWRALYALASSFDLKHEHKEAAFCFLANEWFCAIEWVSSTMAKGKAYSCGTTGAP